MKKTIALALTFMFLVILQGIPLTWNHSEVGAQQCLTEEECRQLLESTNQEVNDLNNQDQLLQLEESDLMGRIEATQLLLSQSETAIAAAEQTIRVVEASITAIEAEITEKDLEIREGEAELEALNTEISDLRELIGNRMLETQRSRFSNIWLELLSQSPDLLSFIRNMTMMANLLEQDARLMDNLTELVQQQEGLLIFLEEQHETLSESRADLAHQESLHRQELQLLAEEQARHQALQDSLTQQQINLRAHREALSHEMALLQVDAETVANQIHQFELLRQEQERLELERQEQARLEQERLEQERLEQEQQAQQPETENPAQPDAPTAHTPAPTPTPPAITPPPSAPGSSHFIIPLERGRVTCEWGNSCYFGHVGIDLGNFGDTSTRILAAADGIVTTSGWHRMYGWHVVMVHNLNGQMFTTLYAHMHTAPFVAVGETIKQGHVLGTMGNTGNSFGAHLHFEIYIGPQNYPHTVNPRDFIHFPASW